MTQSNGALEVTVTTDCRIKTDIAIEVGLRIITGNQTLAVLG